MKNKKGIATIFIFLIIMLVIIGVYLLLLIPLPSFLKIRAIVNYFLIVIVWFVFQGIVVYGYVKLGQLAIKGFSFYKGIVTRITDRTKNLFEVSR